MSDRMEMGGKEDVAVEKSRPGRWHVRAIARCLVAGITDSGGTSGVGATGPVVSAWRIGKNSSALPWPSVKHCG